MKHHPQNPATAICFTLYLKNDKFKLLENVLKVFCRCKGFFKAYLILPPLGLPYAGNIPSFFFRINEWFQLLQYRSKGFSDFTEKRCDKELISHIVLYSASWRKTMSALRIDLILFTSSLDVALWIEIRIVLRIFLRRVGYGEPSRICTMWSHL